jgi:flagellar biogenesis protein FliO
MRRIVPISLIAAASASLCAAQTFASPDAESGPLANLTSGQVIEVPPVAQPGDGGIGAAGSARAAGIPLAPAVGSNGTESQQRQQAKRVSATEAKGLGQPPAGLKRSVPGNDKPQPSGREARAADSASWTDHWLVRTIAALVILGGLLWCVRWFMIRLAAGGVGGLASQLGAGGRSPQGVMEVLGRYPVSRGHTLVLLKMDRRVLLLGQSPAGFTTLSELTDAEDVASILTKTADAEGRTMSRRFGELLRGMERDSTLIDEETGGGAPTTPRLAMRLAGTNVGRNGGVA